MTQQAWEPQQGAWQPGAGVAGLRTSDPPPPAGAAAPEQTLAIRSARKEGRQVVTMRCVERGGACFVECEVYPVSGLRVEPLRPGPYRFGAAAEASAFMDEAVQALTYLGCDVS